MVESGYVHGYSEREAQRLSDQAGVLTELFHHDSLYPPQSRVLDAGCGVGAQTVILARQNPTSHFVAVDRSADSLLQAERRVRAAGLENVEFCHGDLFTLELAPESFDHVFLCFVLEHVPEPENLLARLAGVTKTLGTITAIEGDHGSTFFYPDDLAAQRVIDCLVALQAAVGGDANIGRRLHSVMSDAGLCEVEVSPRFVYADASRPEWVDGFTLRTFTAMVEGVREAALASGWMDQEAFDAGLRGLRRCAEADGTFCYTFFKARGVVRSR